MLGSFGVGTPRYRLPTELSGAGRHGSAVAHVY